MFGLGFALLLVVLWTRFALGCLRQLIEHHRARRLRAACAFSENGDKSWRAAVSRYAGRRAMSCRSILATMSEGTDALQGPLRL